MMQSLNSAWRGFWHTMTSSDRHASHNSPYRTGQHIALPQSRHATLTSVATTAADSRTDLASPPQSAGGNSKSPDVSQTPYSPGMRTTMERTNSDADGEIQMQNFSDGLPPPPPVSHSWKRIERWTEDNYEELWDNLSRGCTQNDINELEHELDCTLPMEVRESLQVHDGQERGGLPTGILFGCMLLDCEEIVQEWKNWRRVSLEYLRQPIESPTAPATSIPAKAFGGGPSSSSSSTAVPIPPAESQQEQQRGSMWREELMARQDSQPSNAIQKSYTHSAWIPLARDWGGNCLAVDLAPGVGGKWGQVIIMGRDYDCKYVVGRSWAAFLATVADDMTSNKVFVHEETGELKLREFKQQGVEPGYLNILRWRADQKYGRKGPRLRRPMNGDIRINSNVGGSNPRISPYNSPVSGDSDRGRSAQRFPTKGISGGSPRGGISSPLARVAEETPPSVNVYSNPSSPRKGSLANVQNAEPEDGPTDSKTQLVMDTDALVDDKQKENMPTAVGVADKLGIDALGSNGIADEDDMKTVEI